MTGASKSFLDPILHGVRIVGGPQAGVIARTAWQALERQILPIPVDQRSCSSGRIPWANGKAAPSIVPVVQQMKFGVPSGDRTSRNSGYSPVALGLEAELL
jgi:hypothetical protein